MTFRDYLFVIARLDIARDLHALVADINDDDTLTSDEKEELLQAIRDKFSTMNAKAIAQRKPRWS